MLVVKLKQPKSSVLEVELVEPKLPKLLKPDCGCDCDWLFPIVIDVNRSLL